MSYQKGQLDSKVGLPFVACRIEEAALIVTVHIIDCAHFVSRQVCMAKHRFKPQKALKVHGIRCFQSVVKWLCYLAVQVRVNVLCADLLRAKLEPKSLN